MSSAKRFLLYAAERPVWYGVAPDDGGPELIPLFAIAAVDRADATRAARSYLLARRRHVSFSDPDWFTHRTVEVLPSGRDIEGRPLDHLEMQAAHDLRIISDRVAARRR